ncbi:MAG TPA: Flp pilus assembly protein CpaB [Clostridiales bacterium]|jgi:pilus assembly protein CpaB|nr:Flp pilus assembly protein CpaB [Clostridiales bacterium]HCS10196.1 Flp pilus assembly protein CpaB [Clostridiales bacterium]
MKKIKFLALVAAVIAAVLLYNFLNTLDEKASVEVVKTGVVTASVNIPPNTPITDDMLDIKQLPVEAVHAEAVINEAAAIGKFSKYEIMAGEQVLYTKLISPEGGGGDGTLAYEIKPGMRAISIGVGNLSGLVGMIRPHNTVDIIAQLAKEEKQPDGEEKTIDYTTMIAENIKVLAVDDVISQEGKSKNSETGTSYTSVTLQVTVHQAMELNMSEYKGQLRLILRSPLDEDIVKPPTIKFDDIIIN